MARCGLWMVLVLLVGSQAGKRTAAEQPSSALAPSGALAAGPLRSPMSGGPEGKEERLREGMKITQIVGRFEAAGEQVTFIRGDGKESLRALQNLALERVVQSIQEERGRYQWVVSGVITEFRGANYLLITRAVISGRDQSSANP